MPNRLLGAETTEKVLNKIYKVKHVRQVTCQGENLPRKVTSGAGAGLDVNHPERRTINGGGHQWLAATVAVGQHSEEHGAEGRALKEAVARVEAETQRSRDADRRRILEDELRAEEERVARLREEFNNGEPERQGDERRQDHGVAAVALGLPALLGLGARMLGIITLGHETPGHFSNLHLRLLEMLCAPVALAIDHERGDGNRLGEHVAIAVVDRPAPRDVHSAGYNRLGIVSITGLQAEEEEF